MKFETLPQESERFGGALERGIELFASIQGKESEKFREKFSKSVFIGIIRTLEDPSLGGPDDRVDARNFIDKFIDMFPKDQFPALQKLETEAPREYQKMKFDLVTALLSEDNEISRRNTLIETLKKYNMQGEEIGHVRDMFEEVNSYWGRISGRELTVAELEEEKKKIQKMEERHIKIQEGRKDMNLLVWAWLLMAITLLLMVAFSAVEKASKGKKH